MTARSVRSMKSIRSLIENDESSKMMQFEDYIAMACDRFNCPYPVVVKKDVQRDDFMKSLKQEGVTKYKTISLSAPRDVPKPAPPPSAPAPNISAAAASATSIASEDEEAIVITSIYDNMHHLAEICLARLRHVPRTLMQILCLIIPYYEHLTKLYFKRCRIDTYTIYELNKVIPMSYITDITLDDCPLPEANYAILLQKRSRINNLSLCRCCIDDEVCSRIATQLFYLEPAEATLGSLNLSFNNITDVGAKQLADALRTNRHLRYLNLASNLISDEGAIAIFTVLGEFPLTYDEITSRRQRLMEYLKAKNVLYMKYLSELEVKSATDELSQTGRRQTTASSVKKKRSSATSLKSKSIHGGQILDKKDKDKPSKSKSTKKENIAKAEIMAIEMVGPFRDPFSFDAIRMKDHYTYCLGNMVLCYFNISYNNLSYLSLKKLHMILVYQSIHKKQNQAGLLRVVMEGNPLPMTCIELVWVGELLGRSVGRLQLEYGARRKSRNRMSMIPDRVKH